MNQEPGSPSSLSLLRNWISLCGLLLAGCSLAASGILLLLQFLSPGTSPYIGIMAFLVLPGFLFLGLATMALGWALERRRRRKSGVGSPPLVLCLDFSRPRVIRNLILTAGIGLLAAMATAMLLYHGYHFTESTQFCGRVCHTVMQPEYTTFQHSPHARLSCADCHIGSGASWYVRSKLSGLRQVFATALGTYSRPIETPVHNLRPARETCEQCHWPSKFTGNLDRTITRYLADETNTPFSVRLLLKVGGGDPRLGPSGGIHWHLNPDTTIEYIATDRQRQVIPWVRVTQQNGTVTEYATKGFTPDPVKHAIRKMDCIDCHNRPSHIFKSPAEAVDLALSLGTLDATLPKLKKTSVEVLTQPYATEREAREAIAARMQALYGNDPRRDATIAVIQGIYADNFFPLMKTDWRTHPNNLGHMEFPGCVRCHDGEHKTADGKETIKANDCNACHVIVAQGRGEQLEQLSAKGHAFEHPGGELDEGTRCSECHTGGPM